MAVTTGVWAQETQTLRLPEDPAYNVSEPTTQLVSSASLNNAPGDDLNKRIAELEKALKKMEDKSAADKKKAAGRPTAVVGGRIHLDAAMFDQNDASRLQVGDIQNGAAFRRARIHVAGEGFDVIDYRIEMDFAGTKTGVTNVSPVRTAIFDQVAFRDVYMTIKELPYIQNVRMGHFKEPFGMEQLESDNSTTFMERSISDDRPIVPGRRIGGMAFGNTEDEMTTWASGVYVAQSGYLTTPMTDTPPFYQNDHGGCSWTSRVSHLFWYDEATEGRGLLHGGLAYSYRDLPPDLPRVWSARPEAYLSPAIVNVQLNIDHEQLLGAETAFVYGPLSFQAEWFGDFVGGIDGQADHTFQGGYAYFSYFLTGENRPYNRKRGYFDRVRPFTNFFRVRTCDGDVQTGWGAWEVGYRWSYLDVLDSSLAATNGAGQVTDHTIGLNWYLNPYTRLMWNYVMSNADRVSSVGGNPTLIHDGTSNTIEMRAQVDF
jgi:phosphate-selective porin OprO/OprP